MSNISIMFWIVICCVIILWTDTVYLKLDGFNSHGYNISDVHKFGLTRNENNYIDYLFDKNFDIDIPLLI